MTTKKLNLAPIDSDLPSLHVSPGFAEWLHHMNGSLVLSTYQSGRVFFIFPSLNGQVAARERVFGPAMGFAIDQDKMWIGIKEQVWRFANIGARNINSVDMDAVYVPRVGYFTGPCNTHDLFADVEFKGKKHEVVFANTLYSCIATVSENYDFQPLWKPNFISKLMPEDRCHLNGIGIRDGVVNFASVCGRYDQANGWRQSQIKGGCVIDVISDEIICEGLSMPHSPRWHRDRLWVIDSAQGDFGFIDMKRGNFVPVAFMPGFARGLHFIQDYALIGLSKMRPSSLPFGHVLKEKLNENGMQEQCGVVVFDLKTGTLAHWIVFDQIITELYDVNFLKNIIQPYTPGFLEPDIHRVHPHIISDLT